MADQKNVLAAVVKLSASLNKMVEEGRDSYKAHGDIIGFAKSHGKDELRGLLALYPVQIYVECFETVGVKSRKELEGLWSRYASDGSAQVAVEGLLHAEDAYRTFIEELDQIMAAHEEQVSLPVAVKGECLQSDVTLVDARTGDTMLLANLFQQSPKTLFVLRKHYV
jgi:hypothetical protein